jgi:hypothetical protein
LLLYLSWTFWWYDLVEHFLGGVWVAYAVVSALAYVGHQPRFIYIIAAITIVGILWEFFEVVIGMPREANYAFDTSIDLLMDVLGSIMGWLYIRHTVPLETRATITSHDR